MQILTYTQLECAMPHLSGLQKTWRKKLQNWYTYAHRDNNNMIGIDQNIKNALYKFKNILKQILATITCRFSTDHKKCVY